MRDRQVGGRQEAVVPPNPGYHTIKAGLLFEPAEEGGYVVTCPSLAGLVTEGDTYDQARQRAVEAIEG